MILSYISKSTKSKAIDMTKLKISIITPSYNHGRYLEETIKSILEQYYERLEYIIIDGGSTDESVKIIKKYEQYLTYWTSERDNGQSSAINKGLRKATGDIITWINSDDILLPNSLNKVSEIFSKNPSIDFIFGRAILFGKKIKPVLKIAETNDLHLRALAGMPYSQPACFFKKNIVSIYGYLDERLHLGMDYDLFVRIALNANMLRVEDVFSKYRLHHESKSITQSLSFANEWAIVFSKVLRSFSFTKNLIDEMKQLGLYCDGNDKYTTNKLFTKCDIEKAFLYFLEFQVHLHYHNLSLIKSKEFTSYIKEYNYDFYKTASLNAIKLKSTFLNKYLIDLLRIFTR
jgi:glycosyltransferase involved in cell wall biosynthesis